jgi:hypothetical protein
MPISDLGMGRRVVRILLFLILLIPSAQFAWQERDMPEFAHLHDDGIFFVSAESLATHHGYRIPSLPEDPYQTKYPPLFPLYLSLIWRMNPHFPANLGLATLFCWVLLVGLLILAWCLYRSDGFSEKQTWLLVGLLAVNPYLILFGSSMFSEVFFSCFVFAALLLARRQGNRAILLAGLAAACAYLSRTAGLALVISIPAWLLWKRDWRRTVLFLAAVLPTVAAWSLWTRGRLPHSSDLTLLYYVDYFGFRTVNFGLDNLGIILWKNIDRILYGMGSLVLPQVVDLPPIKILTQMIAVAMIVGVVRLVRRGVALDYALFGLVSLGTLLVWHYPPNERFVLPIFPLLLAGLVAELEHLGQMMRPALRHRDMSQRVVGALFGAGVAALFLAVLGAQLFMSFAFLQASARQERAKLADRRAAYQWMSANLPAGTEVLSYDDPLLYLYSGHRGNYMPLLPRWWYADDHTSMRNAYRDVVAYCKRRGLTYFYFTTEDLSRETGDDDRKAIEALVRSNPQLKPVYTAGIGTVYRVSP